MAAQQAGVATPRHRHRYDSQEAAQPDDGHTGPLTTGRNHVVLHVDDLGGLLLVGLGLLHRLHDGLRVTAVGHGEADAAQQVAAGGPLRLGEPVQHDSHGPEPQTRRDAEAHVEVLDGPEDEQAQTGGTHDGGDSDHGNGQHQRLVQTGHD